MDGPGQGAPEGTQLRVTPHSPGLRSRIRQGSGSIGSAIQAAELGIGLISGTVLHGGSADETFGEYQARCIAAYRVGWRETWGSEPPPVAVAASILPGTTAERRAIYAAYDFERRTRGIAASRPKGALDPAPPLQAGVQVSPVFHGTPDHVIEAVLGDPSLAAADEIVLFVPPAFDLAETSVLLADFIETIAPPLNWAPTW